MPRSANESEKFKERATATPTQRAEKEQQKRRDLARAHLAEDCPTGELRDELGDYKGSVEE